LNLVRAESENDSCSVLIFITINIHTSSLCTYETELKFEQKSYDLISSTDNLARTNKLKDIGWQFLVVSLSRVFGNVQMKRSPI
jgi:hypothetical protein